MPFGIYVSVDGVARQVKYIYVGGENGRARKVSSAYIGVFDRTPPQSGQSFFASGALPLPTGKCVARKITYTPPPPRTWEELDAMGTTWANWQVATWDDLLYGSLKKEGDVP